MGIMGIYTFLYLL